MIAEQDKGVVELGVASSATAGAVAGIGEAMGKFMPSGLDQE